jgi:pimeloyl-ACP methyl ester carboxylesterase
MRTSLIALCAAAALSLGCTGTNNKRLMTDQRLDRGLVIILPGIEGPGLLSSNVRKGLEQAGVSMGIMVYSWGRPIPLAGPLINQMDVAGNRAAGRRIATYIDNYLSLYPDRPVYLIGHSGGGGVAVFAAESLPPNRKAERLILLGASISSDYDLSEAMCNTRQGIVNFYSSKDEILGATLFVGNVDGGRAASAGLTGFVGGPPGLVQEPWRPVMSRYGNRGRHAHWTRSDFVEAFVAPYLKPRRTGPPARPAGAGAFGRGVDPGKMPSEVAVPEKAPPGPPKPPAGGEGF